jgi:hypothetical protein
LADSRSTEEALSGKSSASHWTLPHATQSAQRIFFCLCFAEEKLPTRKKTVVGRAKALYPSEYFEGGGMKGPPDEI